MPTESKIADVSSATVVPIGRHPKVFPVGTEARHRRLGWVLVESLQDNLRLVRWYEFRRMPEAEFMNRVDDFGDPIVEETEIVAHREWVRIDELSRVRDARRERPERWKFLKRVGALRVAGAEHGPSALRGVRGFLPGG